MPIPLIINGNVIIEEASFSKSHGAAPSRASISTEVLASMQRGSILHLIIGTSQWMGRIHDVRNIKNEQTGWTSRFEAVDFRDDLFSVVVFGQLNMIDRETGEVYSIIEGIYDPDVPYSGSGDTVGLPGLKGQFSAQLREDITNFRDKLRSDLTQFRNTITEHGGSSSQITYSYLIPEFFRSADPNGWILQTPYYGRISTGDLLMWLCGVCGFRAEFSAGAWERITQSSAASWQDARWNVFDLDWGSGQKVSNAMTQVVDALGIQFTMRMDWTRTLYFTLIGEVQYPGLPWEGEAAVSDEDGEAIQDDADTGVWIVGDRDLYEFTDLPYEADWNEAWDSIYWDLDGMNELLTENGLNVLTARLRDLPAEYHELTNLEGEPKEKYLNGANMNDMLVTEYIKLVPYRLYRIKNMDSVLTDPEEYSGERTPREVPINTPLLSDPNKPAIVKAHWWDETQVQTQFVLIPELQEMEKGWRLIEQTGQIWFDEPRFLYTESAADKLFDELVPETDITVEDGTITCCFFGPAYRKFFGTDERIGSKPVSGLRRGFILADSEDDIANAVEYISGDERTADTTAFDIASAYLARPRVIRSGSLRFVGTAGHEVSGEIRRTSVSVRDSDGIVEDVQYANDEPSPEYDAQIEIRRRMADDDLKRAGKRFSNDRRDEKLNRLWREAEKMDVDKLKTGKELRDEWAMKCGAGVITKVTNADRGGEEVAASYVGGDPIIAVPDAEGDRPYRTVEYAEVEEDDERVLGVAATTTDGHMVACILGTYQAYVKGPIEKGDSLVFNKTDWCFVVGGSGIITAEEDYEETEVVRKMVRIGRLARVSQWMKVQSVSNDYLTCRAYNFNTDVTGDEDITVAMDPFLRYSIFHGKTRNGVSYSYTDAQTRTATESGDSITERITPSFQAGDIIRIDPAPMGGTGVEAAPAWLDRNSIGRQFMKSDE